MNALAKSNALMAKNRKYLFYATPFREPILEKARGVWVTDVDGNRYLDLMSGQFSLPLGHSHPAFNKALAAQCRKIIHTNTFYLSEMTLDGARALASITAKGLCKTIFLSTGAEAIECALRYAKQYTGREGIVSLSRGYHGLTLATQSLTNEGVFARPLVPKCYHIPTPDAYDQPAGHIADCLERTRRQLARHRGGIAAFLVEPVIAVGGMIFPPKTYFKGLAGIAEDHGALLICDECQTGLGRTGTWFGYEHGGIVPDMLVLAKGSGLGLPVSAVVMKDHIAEALEGKLMHFCSHQNDPLSGMTMAFIIRYMKQHSLLRDIRQKGSYFLEQLRAIARTSRLLRHPRGMGLMIGFDMAPECFTETFNPGTELIMLLERHGVLAQATRRGRTFRILPSYEITKSEIDYAISRLAACLTLVEERMP